MCGIGAYLKHLTRRFITLPQLSLPARTEPEGEPEVRA